MHTHTHTRTHIHTFTHKTHIHTQARAHTHAHTHIQTNTQTNTQTHTHTHTHKHRNTHTFSSFVTPQLQPIRSFKHSASSHHSPKQQGSEAGGEREELSTPDSRQLEESWIVQDPLPGTPSEDEDHPPFNPLQPLLSPLRGVACFCSAYSSKLLPDAHTLGKQLEEARLEELVNLWRPGVLPWCVRD